MNTFGTDITANFARDLRPVVIEGKVPGHGNVTVRMTVREATVLRDSLNIVLDELKDTVFAKEPT